MKFYWKFLKMEAAKVSFVMLAAWLTSCVCLFVNVQQMLAIILITGALTASAVCLFKNNPKERLNEYLIAKTVPFPQKQNSQMKHCRFLQCFLFYSERGGFPLKKLKHVLYSVFISIAAFFVHCAYLFAWTAVGPAVVLTIIAMIAALFIK